MKNLSLLAVLAMSLFLSGSLAASEELMPPPLPEEGLPFSEEGSEPALDPAAFADTQPAEVPQSEPYAPAQPSSSAPAAAGIVTGMDASAPENAVYDPSYDQHYYIEASALFKQKQYEDAVEIFNKIPPMSHYFISAQTFCGLIATRLGDYPLATAIYQRALKKEPANADLLNRLARVRVLMEQNKLFQARGPVKSIISFERKTKKSNRIKTSVADFIRGGYKTKETVYSGDKIKEVRSYAYTQEGSIKKEMVASPKGTLLRASTWSRDPMDAAGRADGDVWVRIDSDSAEKETARTIWTSFDLSGRALKRYHLDGEGTEVRREEYAYDGSKLLIEIYEGGVLSRRSEETKDQFGNTLKASSTTGEITTLLEYDEFGNWTRKENKPAGKSAAVVERDITFFGR